MWLGKFGFDRIRESDAEEPFINITRETAQKNRLPGQWKTLLEVAYRKGHATRRKIYGNMRITNNSCE